MENLQLNTDPRVADKFNQYPEEIRHKLMELRSLIIEVASEEPSIAQLEETLKWGEPSYLAKKGSTIRIDWKPRTPEQMAIYFKCTSKLVPTFREVYGDQFEYETNRALVFDLDEDLPAHELKDCIRVALTYHSVKHLERLGI